MKYFCNPVNISYRYQFNADPRNGGKLQICREAADPSMIRFKDRYYIFASMTLGVWVSDNLADWTYQPLPEEMPLYDYAPDVRVIGEWVYFCASRREENCDRWRTKDILNGPYEKLEGSFPFWDPNVFQDEDGRIYFYWGCSNITPIYGVELDPDTMNPIGERTELVQGHPFEIGFERIGEDNSIFPFSEEEVEARYQEFFKKNGMSEDSAPQEMKGFIRGMLSGMPYIEGPWVDKWKGKYYLQYAAPGTQYNTYCDGVYVSDHPLGPFRLAENNPFSYKPGGFIPGAGHGSTMQDEKGGWWHVSTMRISVNQDFERRIGLWPAGFDADGELFCNQRYGDWPVNASALRSGSSDPWQDPEWMLLSAFKKSSASSSVSGHEPEKAVDENVQTWWRAASDSPEEWLCLDLGKVYDVRAVQINFADDKIDIPCPGRIRPGMQARYIEERNLITRWKLEGSRDGENWFVIEDKTGARTDLSHDFVVREEGIQAQWIRISGMSVPYGQNPCISGLRVFGLGQGEKPAVPAFQAERQNDLDMLVNIEAPAEDTGSCSVTGYNILFGSSPEKLYHSCMVFTAGAHRIGALIKGQDYYVQVDAFNENGITKGTCVKL